MKIQDKTVIVVQISDYFDKYINDVSNGENSAANIEKAIEFISKNFMLISDGASVITANEEKHILYRQLNWLFSKILFIVVNDDKQKLSQRIRDLVEVMLVKTTDVLMFWYSNFVDFQIDLLKKAVNCDITKDELEINVPGYDIDGILVFSKSVVKNQTQMNSLINFCLQNLANAIDILPSTIISVNKSIKGIIKKLFKINIQCKNASLVFLIIYYQNAGSNQFVKTFLAIIHDMSAFYKNLNEFTQTGSVDEQYFLKIFRQTFIKYINLVSNHVKTSHVTFKDRAVTETLILALVELIYNETMYTHKHAISSCSALIIDVLNSIFLEIRFDEHYIKPINTMMLSYHDKSELLHLFMFKIVIELETAKNYRCKVSVISETWSYIQKNLMIKVMSLNGMLANENLFNTIKWIKDAIQVTIHADFHFTQRHQLRHGLNYLCECETISKYENENPLMNFKKWSYKHIQLDFFDDLPTIVNELIRKCQSAVINNPEIILETMRIFGMILSALSTQSSTLLSDDNKSFMLTIIILPFFSSFENFENVNKSLEFKKIKSFVTSNHKDFFNALSDDVKQELKFECFKLISYMKFNKISKSAMWLSGNFIRFILKTEEKDVQMEFLKCFKNILISNMETMSTFISLYKTFRLNRTTNLELTELTKVLCLYDKKTLVLKTSSFDYMVICTSCEQWPNQQQFSSDANQGKIERWMGYVSKMKAIVVSTESINIQGQDIAIDMELFNNQNEEFYAAFIKSIPACIKHASNFTDLLVKNGKQFVDIILKNDDKVLSQADFYFQSIILSIRKSSLTKKDKTVLFEFILAKLHNLTINCCNRTSMREIQYRVANMIATFGTNVTSNDMTVGNEVIFDLEQATLKSLKLLTYFMIISESEIKGVAVNLALRMIESNGFVFGTFLNWHKRTYLKHVMLLSSYDTIVKKDDKALVLCLNNFFKQLDYPDISKFLESNVDIILAATLPICIEYDQLNLINLVVECCGMSLNQAIEASSLSLYEALYLMEERKKRACLNFITKRTNETFKSLFQMNKNNVLYSVLTQYHVKPNYVIDVIKLLADENDDMTDMDKIADFISNEFLGVLSFFEKILNSSDSEKSLKQLILLSIGDLIRFLNGRRISNLCFKIMSLLKTAIKLNYTDFKEMCISVWKILIYNCNVTSLGAFLGVIFVALEEYIDEYREDVDKICRHLIQENSSLLSTHISDLFFIERTRYSAEIKNIIISEIQSQRLTEGNEFEINLNLLLKHLQNENADSEVKIYCLQYLDDFIKKNRKKFNDLIFSSCEIDESISKLLNVLANCSKHFRNKKLQLQTAICFGELGAVKPALQKQSVENLKHFETTVHSDGFAMKMLKILCPYFKDCKDTRYMESLSLAIQAILQERKVNSRHIIWKSLPETTRELLKPLLTSSYCSKTLRTANNDTIFWNQAQTETDWALLLAATLISSIEVSETRSLLSNIIPSMRDNQEIASFLLPKIILHYFETNSTREFDQIIIDEFKLIFNLVMKSNFYSDASKDEFKYKFIALYNFVPRKRDFEQNNDDDINVVSIRTAKLIFEVWDFLTCFVRKNSKNNTINLQAVTRIENLQKQFCIRKLAEVNFKCGEYERSLKFLEAFILNLSPEEREKELPVLITVYAELRDPDLVEGVKALRLTEWPISDQIFINNFTGNLEGTFALIEKIMKDPIVSQQHIQSIVNCYIQSNQNELALLSTDNLLQKLYECNQGQQYCDEIKAEPLWRLSKFDELETLLEGDKISNTSCWNVICGNLMTKFKRYDGNGFWEELTNARATVMKNFKVYDSEHAMYNNNYSEILHLHMLTEFEKIHRAFETIYKEKKTAVAFKVISDLIKDLDSRRALLQTTTNVIESSLSLRRTLLLITKSKFQIMFTNNEQKQIVQLIDDEIGKTWIECAKIAIKQNMFTQANAFICEAATGIQPDDLFIEQAKYYWKTGDHQKAFKILQTNCDELEKFNVNQNNLSSGQKKKLVLLSKARLNIARYNAEVKNVDFEKNKELFKASIIQGVENEKCSLLYANHIDRHYFSKSENTRSESTNKMNELPPLENLFEIIQAYGESLRHGSEYVLQSMPRFLQIWFDATAFHHNNKSKSRESVEIIVKMNNYVKETNKYITVHQFYTAFSQLISRLCHPSTEVFQIIKGIIRKLIEHYPLQSKWFLMSALKSKTSLRKMRASEIVEGIRGKKNEFPLFINMIDRIMNFAAQNEKTDKPCMEKIGPEIASIFKNTEILMPLQVNLQVNNPTVNQILIHKLDSKFEVMRSLQKPKKIKFVGNDGKDYSVLLKAKDDLRIDFRFMEVLKVINDFYRKDSDASHRCLSVRTYSVIPLNEEIGIIEWVANLNTFRTIITDQYKKAGIKVPSSTADLAKLDKIWNSSKDPAVRIDNLNRMKKYYPPIIGQWFLDHFSTPQSYFLARQNYTKSLGSMSMIGYIMGLGDRHLENILFDLNSGEAVHVDFNCVFNKGESLGYPETVPFRLTHSLIEAMGFLGIEGPFRKCCEVTLKLMQNEKNTLMSYLRPFIYDPMIGNWNKNSKEETENVDPHALSNLQTIEKKLKGVVRKYKGSSDIALSSAGQVSFIINEAISDANLSVMFFHWNPYI